MPSQAVIDAAAKRAASGASTKNTAQPANIPVTPVVTPEPIKTPNQGDISDVFKGTGQFQQTSQQQTYVPSTGQTTYGQQAVETLKNTGGTTQQVNQAQQNVNQQKLTPVERQGIYDQGLLNKTAAISAQETKQALNPNATPQQEAISQISQNKGVSPKEAFATPQAYDQYQERLNGNAATPDTQATQQPEMPQPAPASQQQEIQQPPANLPPNSPSQFSQTTSQVPMQSGNQTMISQTNSQGQTDFVTPEEAHQNDLNSFFSTENSKSMEDDMSRILNAGPDTSAADLLKQNLIMELGMINDPSVNQMLDNSAAQAKASYDSGVAMTQTGLDEINKAIDGTLTAPMSASGLQAKIYKQGKDQQLEAIEAEKDYQGKTHENQMAPLRDNRARLEGYAKAKLAAMGSLDSSAGLTLLSKISQTADIQIQQANLDYNYNHKQLVMKGTQIMGDYTNNVAALIQETNAQKATYLKEFNSRVSDIDDKRFASQQAKQQMRITAISNYNDKSAKLKAEQKQQELDYMKQAYEQHKDLVDQSFKMSGMMGTVYAPDKDGNLVDTGIPTFDATKNQQDYMMKVAGFSLDQAKFGLQKDQFGFEKQKFSQTYALDAERVRLQAVSDHRAEVNSFLDLAKSDIDPEMKNSIEQMMSLPEGALDKFSNPTDIRNYVNHQADKAEQGLKQIEANSPSVASSPNLKQVFNVGSYGGQCGTWASTISTATRVGNTWSEKRTHIDKRDNPQAGDKLLIPAAVRTDGSGWGHVAVVTGFDSNTGTINIVDSNWDNKGTIRQGSFNVNDLNKKYGGDWGYASGQLKPHVMGQLQSLPPEDLVQETYTPSGTYDSTSSNKSKLKIDFTDPKYKGSKKVDSVEVLKLNNEVQEVLKKKTALNEGVAFLNDYNPNDELANNTYKDNQLVYAYMKVMDPGSVVKETEFNTAQKAQGIINDLQTRYGQAQGKGILTPKARASIVNVMKNNFDSKVGEIDQELGSKDYVIKKLGYAPEDIYDVDYARGNALNRQQTTNIKSNIEKSLNGGMNKGQIFQQLLKNPTIANDVIRASSFGYSPDQIVDTYLN